MKVEDCLVYPGRVLKLGDENMLVRTPLGERMLRNDFAHDMRPRDWVSVHYDYVSEKINESYARRMRGPKL